jgi:hypothetical protein
VTNARKDAANAAMSPIAINVQMDCISMKDFAVVIVLWDIMDIILVLLVFLALLAALAARAHQITARNVLQDTI